MHTTSIQEEPHTRGADEPTLDADEIASFISRLLYSAPLYRKLFSLRREHPELAHEIDEIARAVRQITGEIETYVRSRCDGSPEKR